MSDHHQADLHHMYANRPPQYATMVPMFSQNPRCFPVWQAPNIPTTQMVPNLYVSAPPQQHQQQSIPPQIQTSVPTSTPSVTASAARIPTRVKQPLLIVANSSEATEPARAPLPEEASSVSAKARSHGSGNHAIKIEDVSKPASASPTNDSAAVPVTAVAVAPVPTAVAKESERIQPKAPTPAAPQAKPVVVPVQHPKKEQSVKFSSRKDSTGGLAVLTEKFVGRLSYSKEQMQAIRKNDYTSNLVAHSDLAQKVQNVNPSSQKGMKMRGRKGLELNLDDSKIEKVEKAYVPTALKDQTEQDASTAQFDEKRVTKELNNVLNRVMEARVLPVVDELRKLNICNANGLPVLARAVHENAIKQPKFSRAFALLSKELKQFKLEDKSKLSFHSFLLQSIQTMLEKPLSQHIVEARERVDKELAMTTDPIIRKIFEENRDTVVDKKTDAYYANAHFIGELFVADMFTTQKLCDILLSYAQNLSHENATSMVKMLTVAGKKLDECEPTKMNDIISALKKSMSNVKLESFLIYKLDNLMHMRSTNWMDADKRPAGGSASSQDRRGGSGAPKSDKLMHLKLSKNEPIEKLSPPSSWQNGCTINKRAPVAIAKSWALPRTSQSAQGPSPAATKGSTPNAKAALSKAEYEEQLSAAGNTSFVSLYQDGDMSYLQDVCKRFDPVVFVHHVMTQAVDRKPEYRKDAGNMLCELKKCELLPESAFVQAFIRIQPLVPDLLEDCPRLVDYLADITHRFLLLEHSAGKGTGAADCDFLCAMGKNLNDADDRSRGAVLLARSIGLAAKEAKQPDLVLSRFDQVPASLLVNCLGVQRGDLKDFCAKHECAFVAESPASGPTRQSMKPAAHQQEQPPQKDSCLPETAKWATTTWSGVSAAAPTAVAPSAQPANANPLGSVSAKGSKKRGPRQTAPASTSAGRGPKNGTATTEQVLSLFDADNCDLKRVRQCLTQLSNKVDEKFIAAYQERLFRRLMKGERTKKEMEEFVQTLSHFTPSDNSRAQFERLTLEALKPHSANQHVTDLFTSLLLMGVITKETASKWLDSPQCPSDLKRLRSEFVSK